MWKFTNKYVSNNTHGKINEFSRNTTLPGLFGSIVCFIFKTAGSVISLLSQNACLLLMWIAILIIERFQNNKRWIKNADTSPADINPSFVMSWFVSLPLELRPKNGPWLEELRLRSSSSLFDGFCIITSFLPVNFSTLIWYRQ